MNNEELKKKIVDIVQLKLQECPLQPHGIMYRDAAEYIADALIAAGIGDVKEAEHRALVAERALFLSAKEIEYLSGNFDSSAEFFAKEKVIPYFMRQAKKELEEEKKDESIF